MDKIDAVMEKYGFYIILIVLTYLFIVFYSMFLSPVESKYINVPKYNAPTQKAGLDLFKPEKSEPEKDTIKEDTLEEPKYKCIIRHSIENENYSIYITNGICPESTIKEHLNLYLMAAYKPGYMEEAAEGSANLMKSLGLLKTELKLAKSLKIKGNTILIYRLVAPNSC